MTADIEGESLTNFEVNADGTRVRFNAKSADGRPVSFSLPSECMTEMVMSMPRIALEALRRRYKDEQLRIVYPAVEWRIERASHDAELFILTIGTPDGFQASFGLSPSRLNALENSMRAAHDGVPRPRAVAN